MPPRTKGSEMLMKARPLARAQLDRILTLAKSRGVSVVDWHIVGQPNPEAVTGVFQVSSAQAGSFIQQILRINGLRPRIEIFPHGIPVPRQFNVRVRI